MRYKRTNKKIFIFLGLVVCLMTVGYAAFYSKLDITGTAGTNNNWDIEITNVTVGTITGNAENVSTPTWDSLTASMEANIYESGDSVSYDVTVSNLGTLDATLSEITKKVKTNNEAIKITFSGYTKGEVLYKYGETGSTKTITVTISYNDDYSGTLDFNTSTDVSVILDYTQATGSEVLPGTYLVTYDCTTNGGTSCTEYNEFLDEGDSVDLTKTASKEGSTFLGWNTDSMASTALSSLTMGNDDITLYAIWETSKYTVTFDASEGSVSPTKKDVICGQAIGDLPTPTKNNFVFGGWYTFEGDEIDENYVPEDDVTLYARWFAPNIVAVMDGVGYTTLSSAIGEVTANNTKKTIKLLQNVTESNTIGENKNIVINLNGNTINQTSSSKVFTNNGTLELTNGNLTMTGSTNVIDNNSVIKIKNCSINSSAASGAVNNNEDGNMEIIDTSIEMTGSRQGVYNNGGTLKISGETYISNVKDRAALHNLNNGTVTIESGTIISKSNIGAVYNQSGTITIGKKGGTFSNANPVIQGTSYAIAATQNIYFYDGILKGGTSVLNNSSQTVLEEIEDNSELVNDTEDIGGTTYETLYLNALSGVYTVTLNANGGEVTPSSIKVKGGDKIGSLPIPTRNLHRFTGWYTEVSGGTEVTSNYIVEDDVTIIARWEKNPTYVISFEANGGSSVEDIEIVQGSEIGNLPASEKTGKSLEGWYLEDDFQTKVTSSYIPTHDIKLYAKWSNSTFPKVFEQAGECTFNGSGSNITGSACQDYADKKYIDTGISLYSSENINKDYEIGFEIVSYVAGNNVDQATIFNTKLESTGYPGLVFRKKDSTNFELGSRKTSSANASTVFTAAEVTTFNIYRINGEIYYSLNGGERTFSNDLTQYNPTFDLTAWFGAAPANAGGTSAQRYFVGTLKNMYIKLGTYSEDISNLQLATTKTTSSITAVATATSTSGIKKYEFSLDDGETWINNGTNNTYQFTGLTNDTTYNIMVRVTSNNDETKTKTVSVKTNSIGTPTFDEVENDGVYNVIITYPSGCTNNTCEYSINAGSTWTQVNTNSTTVSSLSIGDSLIARTSDGTNTVSSTYTIIPTISINELKNNVVTTGDGLYDNGDGTYTYKGADPDNYLSFEGSTWRILGIDSQGLKIIRDERLNTEMAYDTANARTTDNNSYCTNPSYGCNVWAATSHLVGTPAEFVNGLKHGTVTQDATLNTYLNGDYYTNTLHSNSNIISGTFNVGPYGSENSYQWQGHVALLTVPEYTAAGGSSSYLKKSYYWQLVSTNSGDVNYVRLVGNDGNINHISDATYAVGIRPVLYLSSDIMLRGLGTQSTPYEIVEPTSVSDLTNSENIVTSGDGLYNNGDGTYTYKGANPDNYLSFEGSTWRILGIDNQGIKIIRDEKLSTEMAYDTANTRTTANNSYCTSQYGCNAWAATSHLVGTPAEFVNGLRHGTVTQDATLNTYLNGDYYTNTLHSNSNIISGTFNVGPVTYNNNDLAAAKTSEASYQWQGHIALAIPSEYLAANTDQTNCGTESLNNTNYSTCSTTNYLYKSYNWWLVSAASGYPDYVRNVYSGGSIGHSGANSTRGVRPVLYLSSSIHLDGEGTNDGDIFTIVE